MRHQSILAWRGLILRFRIWTLEHWTQNEILDQVRFFPALWNAIFKLASLENRKLLVFYECFVEFRIFSKFLRRLIQRDELSRFRYLLIPCASNRYHLKNLPYLKKQLTAINNSFFQNADGYETCLIFLVVILKIIEEKIRGPS